MATVKHCLLTLSLRNGHRDQNNRLNTLLHTLTVAAVVIWSLFLCNGSGSSMTKEPYTLFLTHTPTVAAVAMWQPLSLSNGGSGSTMMELYTL